MHEIKISQATIDAVTRRTGRRHPFDTIDPRKTALVVIDMQNHFMAPGYMAETPAAREIVPAVNKLAAGVRAMGGHVIWIQKQRYASMDEAAEGHKLYPTLEPLPEDTKMPKKRFSAFIQGSSDIERTLRARGIDTLLIAGTATQVCCESTARDACMLNYKTLMIADANATSSDELHNASLNAFHMNFGDVQTVDEVLESLARGAKTKHAAVA
jgi:ureidoacrylate peracid hydrolase